MGQEPPASSVIVAVPVAAVAELETRGIAEPLPTVRGAVLEAVITVGVDAAALVTWLQAPDTVMRFAEWVKNFGSSSGDALELEAKRGGTKVSLKVTGEVPVDAVADFLRKSIGDPSSPS